MGLLEACGNRRNGGKTEDIRLRLVDAVAQTKNTLAPLSPSKLLAGGEGDRSERGRRSSQAANTFGTSCQGTPSIHLIPNRRGLTRQRHMEVAVEWPGGRD